jgi:Tfp pilus assembly protein PilN
MSLPAEKPAVPVSRPAARPRRGGGLNLSQRPFVNTRPVTRLSLLLWLLGTLLLLGNVSLFWSYLSGSAEKRQELAGLEQEIQRQNRTVSQLEQRLSSLNLEEQNRQVRFLNRQIAARTFSWSLLFDRLAEVLPDDIRIIRLAPRSMGRQESGRPADEELPLDDRVRLAIAGQSKDNESIDAFVDNLFAHPSFGEPNLSRESREEGAELIQFDVQVIYIPGGRNQQGVVVEEDAPGPQILETPPVTLAPAAPATPETEIE